MPARAHQRGSQENWPRPHLASGKQPVSGMSGHWNARWFRMILVQDRERCANVPIVAWRVRLEMAGQILIVSGLLVR